MSTARLASVVLLFLSVSSSQAAEVFDFIVDDSGNPEVFATLTLRELPAYSVDDVLELSFSPAAQEFFGFPEIYEGTFDQMSLFETVPRLVASKIDRGLAAINGDGVDSLAIQDVTDVPNSSLVGPGGSTFQFLFLASEPHQDDRLTLRYRDATGMSHTLRKFGSFLPQVPEPNSLSLTAIFLLSLAGLRQGRD